MGEVLEPWLMTEATPEPQRKVSIPYKSLGNWLSQALPSEDNLDQGNPKL